MRRLLIGDRSFDEDSVDLQTFLPRAYEQKLRPHCQCREP